MRFPTVILVLLVSLSPATAEPPRALSRGDARDGSILGAQVLPLQGRGFTVLPATVKRGYRHGTDRLVNAIVQVSESVRQAHPGFTLGVGNLSRKGGGDIPQSRSHNSGRDADIALPLRDSTDRIVFPRALVRLGSDNTSLDGTRRRLAPDVAWTLVDRLLSLPSIDVAWIFCSRSVRDAILKAAIVANAPPDRMAKAAVVLRQPSDSNPHDDHFHVRIYCSPLEISDHGCVDRELHWPWIVHGNAVPVPPREAIDTAQPLLKSGHGEVLDAPWSEQIDGLIALLKTHPEHGTLVLRRLRTLTGSALPIAGLSARGTHLKWARWWARNRARYGLTDPLE